MDRLSFHEIIDLAQLGLDQLQGSNNPAFWETLGDEKYPQLKPFLYKYLQESKTSASIGEFYMHLATFLLQTVVFLRKENSCSLQFEGVDVDPENRDIDMLVWDFFKGEEKHEADYYITINFLSNGNYKLTIHSNWFTGDQYLYYDCDEIVRVLVTLLCLSKKVCIADVPQNSSLCKSFDQLTYDLGINKP